VPANQLYAVK